MIVTAVGCRWIFTFISVLRYSSVFVARQESVIFMFSIFCQVFIRRLVDDYDDNSCRHVVVNFFDFLGSFLPGVNLINKILFR